MSDTAVERMLAAAGDAPSKAPDWTPPAPENIQSLLPDYAVQSLVGRGGMGAVYRGMQRSLDRPVAIKVLPPEVAGRDPQFAARFQQEARAMARLSHPHIVPVHDFGETPDGMLYFVMEFIDGTDLQRIIKSEGHLSPRKAAAIIAQVCDALEFAHENGIVHRDIKPSNVMVDQRGQVKVADFGLAKSLEAKDILTTAATMTGTIMGTLAYMAPEQAQGKKVDHRADIYSVGAMFYEMLTGEVPHGAIEPPSHQCVEVDVRLDKVVLKALARDPDRRYQHASEVKTDVTRITDPPVVPKKSGTGRRIAVVTLVSACLAVGAFFALRQQHEGRAAAPSAAANDPMSSNPEEASARPNAVLAGASALPSTATPATVTKGPSSPFPADDTPPQITEWHDVMDVAKVALRTVGKVEIEEQDGWVVAKTRSVGGCTLGSTEFADVALKGRLRGAVGVTLRSMSQPNGYYSVMFDPEKWNHVERIEYKEGWKNVQTPLADLDVKDAAEHEFLIVMVGDQMRVWVEGTLAATARDSLLTMGRVGLHIPTPGSAIRDLAIAEIHGEESRARDRAAALRVLERGGTVIIRTPKGTQTIASAADLPASPFALEMADMQTNRPNAFSDDDMALFAGLTALQTVNLRHTKVTGTGFAVLKTLPKLNSIRLEDNRFLHDADLAVIRECRALAMVGLGHPDQFTSAVLAHMAEAPLSNLDISNLRLRADDVPTLLRMRKLTKLFIGNSGLTAADVEKLAALPALENFQPSWESIGRPIDFTGFARLKRMLVGALNDQTLQSLFTATRLEFLQCVDDQVIWDEPLVKKLASALKELKQLDFGLNRPLASGQHFSAFPKLESVTVQSTNNPEFDNAILLSLADIAKLKRVTVYSASPKLTKEGIAQFRKLRPDVPLEGPALP
ncbi:MAG: serine/threonine protein kinase [Verrucomicrobiaceae bacterium]|nr:serine/threonine protein kinase [Verrucomicrobiaceae bacterium]